MSAVALQSACCVEHAAEPVRLAPSRSGEQPLAPCAKHTGKFRRPRRSERDADWERTVGALLNDFLAQMQVRGNPGLERIRVRRYRRSVRALRLGQRSPLLLTRDGALLRQTAHGLEEIEPTRAFRTPRPGREGAAALGLCEQLTRIVSTCG